MDYFYICSRNPSEPGPGKTKPRERSQATRDIPLSSGANFLSMPGNGPEHLRYDYGNIPADSRSGRPFNIVAVAKIKVFQSIFLLFDSLKPRASKNLIPLSGVRVVEAER